MRYLRDQKGPRESKTIRLRAGDIISEIHNLSSNKLYEVIKILYKSFCKIRNKYFDLK